MEQNQAKRSKYKFAFTGTNSSGKTTMTLDVTARMKLNHVLAECVTSQDRKVTWKDAHFPETPIAHYGMICNTINAETQAVLKGDADVVFTDRSVLDLYAIALTDHPHDPLVTEGLWPMVEQYLKTYTRIYYLPPLAYQEDGKRPSDDFRMRTHSTLRSLMNCCDFSNIVELPREEVFKDIQKQMGVFVPNPIWAEAEKWQSVANALNETLVVKHPRSEVSSDLDVFVLLSEKQIMTYDESVLKSYAQRFIRFMFGDQVNADILFGPLTSLSNADAMKALGNYTIYHAGARHVAQS